MNQYCGHISVLNGVVSIDLGDKNLPDGVYSIVKESGISHRLREKNITAEDKEKLRKQLLKLAKKQGIPLKYKDVSLELDIKMNTLHARVKQLDLKHLFRKEKADPGPSRVG